LKQFAEALGDQAAMDLLTAPADHQLARLEMFSSFMSSQSHQAEQAARAHMDAAASLTAEMLKSAAESRARASRECGRWRGHLAVECPKGLDVNARFCTSESCQD